MKTFQTFGFQIVGYINAVLRKTSLKLVTLGRFAQNFNLDVDKFDVKIHKNSSAEKHSFCTHLFDS